MSSVKFDYLQQIYVIPCNENEKMKDICKRLANKINLNLSDLYFMYSGNILNLDFHLKKL